MIGVSASASREKLRGLELMLPLSTSTPLERPYRPVGDSWYAPEVFEQKPLTITDSGRHCPLFCPAEHLMRKAMETTHHFNPMDGRMLVSRAT